MKRHGAQGGMMQKPGYMAVATAVFMAGISNAFIYTLGYVALVAIQFLMKNSGDATLGSATSAFIITLMFSLLLSTIITFVLAFPIAAICRKLGCIGNRSYLVAPAVGAVLACWVASKLDVALTTYIAIIAFAYITAAIMWLALTRGNSVKAPIVASQPAS
jgi:hypothetical protein